MKRPRTKVQRYISPSIITGCEVYVALTIQPCLQRGAIVPPAREVVLLERELREPSQMRTKVG